MTLKGKVSRGAMVAEGGSGENTLSLWICFQREHTTSLSCFFRARGLEFAYGKLAGKNPLLTRKVSNCASTSDSFLRDSILVMGVRTGHIPQSRWDELMLITGPVPVQCTSTSSGGSELPIMANATLDTSFPMHWGWICKESVKVSWELIMPWIETKRRDIQQKAVNENFEPTLVHFSYCVCGLSMQTSGQSVEHTMTESFNCGFILYLTGSTEELHSFTSLICLEPTKHRL